ncbi:MAG: sulfatase-like hydrolase/transferase, partial [Spirochaetes bacterium]|nr:sulfatase-like hydrolase/transferase [Spirochaetota bacterium]
MKKPNMIVILADDLGYGDLGCYGSTVNHTPNCDGLASSGIRFRDFHAPAAKCVPSRAGLLTGCHPYRDDVMHRDDAIPWRERPFPVKSMAAMLREQDYATALIGKWHLGMENGCHPLDQGFDYYYGTPSSNDNPAPPGTIHNHELFRRCEKKSFPIELFRMRELVECPADQELFIQRYTKEAVEWITTNADRPFFLYLAQNAPHVPVFP